MTIEHKAGVLSFVALCLGGYFLAICYGVTFLLPLLVQHDGGDESTAGMIISAGTISTVLVIVFSGHLADRLGLVRAAAWSGLVLAMAMLGFALAPPGMLVVFGFLLGMGWGVYYTLGPILVAAIVRPEARVQSFGWLSGSMMAGIGTGPLLGRVLAEWGWPVESAFWVAGGAGVLGGVLYFALRCSLPVRTVTTQSLTVSSGMEVLRSRARFPIVMVGLGGCIFGALSSFQTSYAVALGFDYGWFFANFTLTVIACRLLLGGLLARRNPVVMAWVLSGLIVAALVMLIVFTTSAWLYGLAAVVLGVGYGLTYTVINGQVASEAPEALMPQALLLFSLSYFVGLFGAPLVAGELIVGWGIFTMLYGLLGLAVVNHGIMVYRLLRHL